GRRALLGPLLDPPLRFAVREPARRNAFASLRHIGDGGPRPLRRGARSWGRRMGVRRRAGVRLGVPGRALRGRPDRGRRADRGRPCWGPRSRGAHMKAERDTFDDSVEEVRELMASADLEQDAEGIEQRSAALLQNRRQLISLALAVLLMVVAIYVVFPKLVGVSDAIGKLSDATWYWVVVAVAFNGVRFLSYTSLFRGVLSGTQEDTVNRRLDLRASYQITMAGFAATILFSAGGAGGVALTYWALRKAGMERRRAACRMVAFMVVLYTVYLVALVLFGTLLSVGVLSGEHPLAGTIVPGAVAAGALLLLGLVALLPGDFERRLAALRRRRRLQTLATGPATLATGVRTAIAYI